VDRHRHAHHEHRIKAAKEGRAPLKNRPAQMADPKPLSWMYAPLGATASLWVCGKNALEYLCLEHEINKINFFSLKN
jgi:hypothetical protein